MPGPTDQPFSNVCLISSLLSSLQSSCPKEYHQSSRPKEYHLISPLISTLISTKNITVRTPLLLSPTSITALTQRHSTSPLTDLAPLLLTVASSTRQNPPHTSFGRNPYESLAFPFSQLIPHQRRSVVKEKATHTV